MPRVEPPAPSLSARIDRYVHTLRHLKPRQLYYRAIKRLGRATPDLRPAPPLRSVTGSWRGQCERSPSMLGSQRFRLLNEERELTSPSDWNHPDWPTLWLYNLHYFDHLAQPDIAADQSDALIARWISENPPARGIGWEPYPTSLRIVNWIKGALAGRALTAAAVSSLAIQIRWLQANIEEHLLGNHLLANAKALIFGGVFFSGDEPRQWLRKGLELLERELPEQVLADGGHFERSPMYHSIILEDLLDLCALTRSYPEAISTKFEEEWRALAQKMRAWLAVMTHPDGEIVLFNDAAFNIALVPAQLDSYAERLGFGATSRPREGLTLLPETGYARLAIGGAVLFVDVAPIGPDYLPGHAHADTLTFELSLFGRRVIVDSGTSTYEPNSQREFQRSTAAHNTVEVDCENSSETWGAFRVARRARPFGLELIESNDLIVSCAHDGYRRLPGRVIHRREWRLGERALQITDGLTGKFGSAVSRFHFHPGVAVQNEPTGKVSLSSGDHRMVWSCDQGAASLGSSHYYPEFGVSLPNISLVLPQKSPTATHRFAWD